MTDLKDKSSKQLVSEIERLNKTIQVLKKRLHSKFFSSLQDMTMEDYELIAEQEKDAIFKGNKKGDFILVNDFAAKLTGYSEEELLNMHISELFKSKVLDQKPLRFDLVIAGKSIKNQRTITKKDGSLAVVEMTSKKLSDESLICVMRDISKEDELKSALKLSEDKFQEIFDNAADMMVLSEFKEGKIPIVSDVNKSLLKKLKYTKKELIGKNISKLFEEKTKTLHQTFSEKILLSDKVFFESKYKRKDSNCFPVEVSGKLIKIGKEKYIQTISRDISERLEVQNQIKASEEKYRLLFELLPYGGEVINTRGFITEVSPGTATMLGYKRDELVGKHISTFIIKEDVIKFKQKFPNLLKGKKEEAEICLIKKNGSVVRTIRAGQPIFNNEGKVDSILTLSIDISERVDAETKILEKNKEIAAQNEEYQTLNEELQTKSRRLLVLNDELILAKEKAEESSRLKTAFLANMSHEIRTPMNGILGFSQLLNTSSLSDEKISEYTKIIIKSGKHLLSIINDIIDISKIDAGQVMLNKTTFNVNHLLQELLLIFKSQKTENFDNDVELRINLPLQDKDVNISTDETRFRQVITNLMNNAVKFTEKGYIECGYIPEKDKLVFYVKDTGIGIKRDMQLLIFERFTQATINTEKLYGGTGLGLSISKACSELLGGNIWLESEYGKGSTFYFSLPYKKATKAVVKKTEVKTHISFSNETILVVEDESINLAYLKEILSKYDLNIVHVDTAKKAIDAVKNTKFHLVLMDIQLPGNDGNYATSEIKKINPKLPVIAQSAYSFENEKQKSYEAGCDGYIVKPIKKELLLQKIKEYILT